jgi:hypothetical protein
MLNLRILQFALRRPRLMPLASFAQETFKRIWKLGRRQFRACPDEVVDFVDKDMLQHNEIARFLFGEVTLLRREARYDQPKPE